MQRNSPGRTPRLKFSIMVLPPSSSVTSVNAICGVAEVGADASWRIAAMAMMLTPATRWVDVIDRGTQVRLQHRLRARNVARENAIGEQLMFAHESLGAADGT